MPYLLLLAVQPPIKVQLKTFSSFLGLAVVCAAIQVAEACTKLYQFRESFQDALEDVTAIIESLRYLSNVFEDIENAKKPLAPSVAEGTCCCQRKIAVCHHNNREEDERLLIVTGVKHDCREI